MPNERNLKRSIQIVLVLAITCCCVLLFPQVRNFIVEIAEKYFFGRELVSHNKRMDQILTCSVFAILCFGVSLVLLTKRMQDFLKRHKEKIACTIEGKSIFSDVFFVYASIGIAAMSIIVRVVMLIESPSLWGDEAELAASIVSRNWFKLLVPPLSFNQSAPVLYVLAEKAIGSLIGYSEFSLRLFSFLSFLGLLICEIVFLKKIFNFNKSKISFVVIMSALLPTYIWYSNELKPYMSDAFFCFLTILLYYYYTKGKVKLSTLTILCILFFGFSTPAIFFTGGILLSEFLIAVFTKNKRLLFYIVISGTIIILIFGLYYYWWHSPISKYMLIWWTNWYKRHGIMDLLKGFFSSYNSVSTYVWFFFPFAILGIYSLIIRKNKIACMVVLSLFFVFLASASGRWPLSSRLWLFLPVIIFIFTPIGYDFIRDKIKIKHLRYITTIVGFLAMFIMTIYLSINCLAFFGDKMYLGDEDINPLIFYIQENIREDEKLYVHKHRKAQVQFKIGYSTTKIGNVETDNIIYSGDPDEWYQSDLGKELLSIIENKKVYLIKPSWPVYDGAMEVLRNYGTLTEVMNIHDTPLYYFERNSSNE